jgi:arylsulfate sulfotransferase
MKKTSTLILTIISLCFCRATMANLADDTVITIDGQTAGATPFLSQLTLTASDSSAIKSIRFAITPKSGSTTRPLSGTYSHDYLADRGYLDDGTGKIFLHVYGLYDSYANAVTLTYSFNDGSSKQDGTTITTAAFADPCGYKTPTVLQAKAPDANLSYDYIMIKGACSSFSPAIIDTDGALRWVGTANAMSYSATFFENAIYQTDGTSLYRIDLDGSVTLLHDYADIGVTYLHHNIDRGKTGIILEANTDTQDESTLFEVDGAGNVLKIFDMADIISAAMIAGGDDPSLFVYPGPTDWFHNNSSTYNRADDSLLVSSRENFVIALDYESSTVKWILGDPTKNWHQFPSLQQFELVLASGSLPPIGQHGLSISYDQHLLLFDNGTPSNFQMPPGDSRPYASQRKYALDLEGKIATEVWNYDMDQSVYSPICGSVYEDAPLNYLADYADVNGPGAPTQYGQLLALNAAGEKVFYYQYNTFHCDTLFNSIPLHLESTSFPAIEGRPLNLSTRGVVGTDEDSLIGGFIVAGTNPQTVVLRALGPSLSPSGLPNTVADPILTVHDSTGTVIATNDDWESDPFADQLIANGLAPSDPVEAATVQTLEPGAYTFVVASKDGTPGIGLVEAYDFSPLAGSKLANLSTRGSVGTGADVLIGGLILGDVDSSTVVIRALGPSLASAGITAPLSDPMLTVYDSNGAAIASNDNWQDDISAPDITKNQLAPTDPSEAATLLHLPAGAYTTVVSGTNGEIGIGLVEFFDLRLPAE